MANVAAKAAHVVEADARHTAKQSWQSWALEGQASWLTRQHNLTGMATGWASSVVYATMEAETGKYDDVGGPSAYDSALLRGTATIEKSPLVVQQLVDYEARECAKERKALYPKWRDDVKRNLCLSFLLFLTSTRYSMYELIKNKRINTATVTADFTGM